MSPTARISRSGAVMYCSVPVFAYKIIWASILPQTDLCHSEDSFTSPSLSLHWSLLNFSPSAPFPWRCYFFPKCPTFALAVRDGESDGAVVINKFVCAPCQVAPPSSVVVPVVWRHKPAPLCPGTPPPFPPPPFFPSLQIILGSLCLLKHFTETPMNASSPCCDARRDEEPELV